MPKWKKDTKEFEVGVNYVENRGYSSSIPKPIIEMLGNPESIKFVVNDNNEIALVSGKSSIDNKIKYVNSNTSS
jgi:hypothetical protein